MTTPQPGAPDLPYHRLALANPRHRWWRPLLTLLCSTLAYVLMLGGILVAGGVLVLARPQLDAPITAAFESESGLESPLALVVGMGILALLIPAVAIGIRLGEKARLGRLSSVEGRLRTRLLLPMLALAVLVMLPSLIVDTAVQWRQGTLELTFTREAWIMIGLALLVVPFQSAAEEYVFRALPQQVLGAWLRSPWWGILLPVPVFVLGHEYDVYGQTSIAIFALAMGVLVWRTGGLEAAIALHVVNNVVVTLVDVIGLAEAATHEVSAADFWLSTGVTLVFTGLALVYHRQLDPDGPRNSDHRPALTSA